MKLDGFGLFVKDMATMVRFYRDVLGFEIKESEDAVNVYLIKDGTLFMLYGRDNFEKMTNTKYQYTNGFTGTLKWRCMLIPLTKWTSALPKLSARAQHLYLSLQLSLGDNVPAMLPILKEILWKSARLTSLLKGNIVVH